MQKKKGKKKKNWDVLVKRYKLSIIISKWMNKLPIFKKLNCQEQIVKEQIIQNPQTP